MSTHLAAVIGGMGPEAGLDLVSKVVAVWRHTSQKPVRYLFVNEADIPDRTEALLDGGADFVPAVVDKIARLTAAGATFAALGCNTAHARLSLIRQTSPIPVLDMIELTCDEISRTLDRRTPIGILGTRATIQLDLYGTRLRQMGYQVVPSDEQTTTLSHAGITAVKHRQMHEGGRRLALARSRLLSEGAGVIVMGCTEIPLALCSVATTGHIEMRPHLLIDPTFILAKAIVEQTLR